MIKFQVPSSKLQGNPKLLAPNQWQLERGLDFGIWSFFGTWNLELGVSP